MPDITWYRIYQTRNPAFRIHFYRHITNTHIHSTCLDNGLQRVGIAIKNVKHHRGIGRICPKTARSVGDIRSGKTPDNTTAKSLKFLL